MRQADSANVATIAAPIAALGWFTPLLRMVLRGLWFVAIPALACALSLRYLIPQSSTAPGLEGALANVGRRHLLVVAIALFVGVQALVRYWRVSLPGGRYLSTLPIALVERVPLTRIIVCEHSLSSLRWLESRSARAWLAGSAVDLRLAVEHARAQLGAALSRGKWSRVPAAQQALHQLIERAEGRAKFVSTLAFVGWLGLAALLALAVRANFYRSYEILGTSMLPALSAGDLVAGKVLANPNAELMPRRGDIVVLQAVVDGRPLELVKRVIGLPGDHVEMQGAHPVINGWPVPVCGVGAYYSPDDESAVNGDPGGVLTMEYLEDAAYLVFQAAPAGPFPGYVVKPGEIFVMGDNRSNSRDSRDFGEGVPRAFAVSDIKAKVTRLLLSRTRRGDFDLKSILQPVGQNLNLHGVDIANIQVASSGCLAGRPNQTRPPRPVQGSRP